MFKRNLFIILLFSVFSFSVQAQNCDRSCLAEFLDAYLNALVANDASAAPLSYGFRQTENSVVTPNDEGLWSSVSALGELQRRYYDPEGSSAGYFGLLEEGNAERAVVSLRLRVSGNQITEAEWHIGRENDAGLQGEPGTVYWDADELIANPPNQGVVPLERRYSRDGIIAQNSKVIKGHPGCSRRENGLIRHVHTAMFYARPDQPVPNWPPFDGNFPLVPNNIE